MRKSLLAGIAVAALALSGCAAEAEEVVEEVEETVVEEAEPIEEPAVEESLGTIVEVASAAEGFSTLVAAVEAAGLVETLSGEGPFTVFAPTDEAFDQLPPGLLDALLEEENRDILVQILRYHVVASAVFSEQVVTGPVASVEGSTIALEVTDAGVTVAGANTTANVVTPDIEASNGVIHVIDAVILPEGLDLSALLN
jgi:uncharacterized surface protein with fasciclin (FAS1) repeats